ncbi:MAG TPA: efflux RND transporter periplasmic adaptor subunit [Terriglobia bacterium]|nr:efflux RND transporter periplasmic adaptor subunit [Terriglobia bacterium]
MTVQVAAAERTSIQRRVTADAVLYPLRQAVIVPKISAPVSKFYVNRGSHVHAGELLAQLENRDLAASVTENKGAYDQAQAQYDTATKAAVPEEVHKAELDLKAAQEVFDAQQKIYNNRQTLYKQGAIARKDLDDSYVTYTQAQNQLALARQHLEGLQSFAKADSLKVAEGQLAAAKGKYLGAQAQLGYSEIRSPIDGAVTDRPLNPGEMASSSSPLITVINLSEVVARAHISQAEAAALRVGNQAVISAPGLSDVPGKVTVVSPALDPTSTTVEVWVQATNPGERLKPGTSVRVSIVAETVSDAVVIPAAALLTAPDGGTSVIVAGADNKPEQKSVKTGIREGDDVQITDGLKAGERVVTVGAFELASEDPDVLARTKLEIQAPAKSEEGSGKESGKDSDAPSGKDSDKD